MICCVWNMVFVVYGLVELQPNITYGINPVKNRSAYEHCPGT
jgi:hypothetical protein